MMLFSRTSFTARSCNFGISSDLVFAQHSCDLTFNRSARWRRVSKAWRLVVVCHPPRPVRRVVPPRPIRSLPQPPRLPPSPTKWLNRRASPRPVRRVGSNNGALSSQKNANFTITRTYAFSRLLRHSLYKENHDVINLETPNFSSLIKRVAFLPANFQHTARLAVP